LVEWSEGKSHSKIIVPEKHFLLDAAAAALAADDMLNSIRFSCKLRWVRFVPSSPVPKTQLFRRRAIERQDPN